MIFFRIVIRVWPLLNNIVFSWEKLISFPGKFMIIRKLHELINPILFQICFLELSRYFLSLLNMLFLLLAVLKLNANRANEQSHNKGQIYKFNHFVGVFFLQHCRLEFNYCFLSNGSIFVLIGLYLTLFSFSFLTFSLFNLLTIINL